MAILTSEQRHDLGKAFYFIYSKFTLLCMSILTLEQILIWVVVFVLDQYLYLVYLSTWSAVLDHNPAIHHII